MTYRVTVSRLPLTVDFDAGSIGEAIAILQNDSTELSKMFEIGTALVSGTVGTDPTEGAGGEPVRRGRKPNKDKQPDPATANAPPPMPVPGAATAADGIPAELRRDPATNTSPAVPAAPPPPPVLPAPAAPSLAPPPAPPSGVNAGKVIAALEQRVNANPAAADAAKVSLADWLAGCGLVRKGATYDEAVSVVRMSTDEKLSPLLPLLGIS